MSSQRILLSGATTPLGAALRERLGRAHTVVPLADADLEDRARLAAIGEDVDAVIHLTLPDAGADEAVQLAAFDHATRGTYDLLTAVRCERFILVSSLRPFCRYPPHCAVDERWAPRPTTELADLIPYLAEVATREVTRVRPAEAVVLRLGDVVGNGVDVVGAKAPASDLSLHVEDAIQGVERALAYRQDPAERPSRFHVFHIVDGAVASRFPLGAAAKASFGYAPTHQVAVAVPGALPPAAFEAPARRERPVQNVTIYGAGGPLGAITAKKMADEYRLRLTDVRALAEIAQGPPQSPGAPLPEPPQAPHEEMRVDVTDFGQVLAAAEGADALVNCTVLRHDPVGAFRVNTLGALNVMRAAVAHGIMRVVHTGPILTLLDHPAGYNSDFGLHDDLPPRPGDDLYFVSKHLGTELVRIFAEEHGLSVPALLFCNFVEPGNPVGEAERARFFPFTVSWADAGEAMRLAVGAQELPGPFVPLHIQSDLPHGKYVNAKAKRVLGWQPQDTLRAYWEREVPR